MLRRIRVLVGKPGLDGHDRGAKVVAAALRDAGMEVIYTGLHQTSEQVVEAAVQEDVDVVALSILSGAHMTLFPDIRELMMQQGVGDKLLTGGGIIPADDMTTLASQGIGRLFGPGTNTQDIVRYIREWYAGKHGADALPPLPPPPPRPEPVVGSGELRFAPTSAARAPERKAIVAKPVKKSVAKPAAKSSSARKAAPKKAAKKVAKKSAKPTKKVAKRPAKKATSKPVRKAASKNSAKRVAARPAKKAAKKKAARRR